MTVHGHTDYLTGGAAFAATKTEALTRGMAGLSIPDVKRLFRNDAEIESNDLARMSV